MSKPRSPPSPRRLVLERGYRKKGGAMSGRHIAIHTWLEALGLQSYLPLFFNYGGVEDLLYASEAEVRDLGLKNSAHRAKIVSSLRILREKYEKGKSTGSGVFALQQPRSPTSPTGAPIFPDFPPVIASPEKLQQDLQRELNADASELKSRGWYHGNITRQRAESLVAASGDFLVRDSISKPGDFVLTCCWRGVPLHFVVNALVAECAPGSLPTIAYQFEEESFGSIQELIQFYLTRLKPVTVASGAVLRNPIPRSMPLSYYDSKYGAAHYNPDNNGGYYTPSQSPKPSPFCTPETSPKTSPVMNRRAYKRTGSQPLLTVVDDIEVDRSRSPSLERFGSLPVINVIPPGGPGYVGGEGFHHKHHHQPHHHHHHHPHGGGGGGEFSGGGGRTSPAPIVAHQRSGSAPVLMNDDLGGGGGEGGRAGGGGLSHAHSARMAPAGSESNLSRAPPPKPSRIPSIKYKKRPVVVVRNPELYEEDDGRDYTDPDQLSGPPSWAQPGSGSHAGVPRIPVGGGGRDLDLEPDTTTPPFPPYNPPLPSSSVMKSHSFQGNTTRGSDEDIYDNNFNNLNKGYQTLPVKSKTAKHSARPRLSSASSDPFSTSNIIAANNDNCRLMAEEGDLTDRKITMPGFNLGSRLSLDAFSTHLFSAQDNRLLEPSAVMKFKHLLLSSNARAIAGHVTKVDLEVLRVSREDDLGVGVTSGIELCTLPQGDQLRNDIIERCECQRLFVMTSLMTCNAVSERAKMLSQWIETAGELRSSMGNLFSFASVMEALSAPQVHRLRDTWLILRQKHTSSAYLFDTKLKTLLKSINEGSGLLPLTNITVPNLKPVVHLLHRDLDECCTPSSPWSLLSWESSDPNLGLDFLLSHLDIARIVASQSGMYRRAAAAVLNEVKVDGELEDVCRTEFQMKLMWGSKGARAPRSERVSKFEQLLGVLSERLEAPGDDGTEV